MSRSSNERKQSVFFSFTRYSRAILQCAMPPHNEIQTTNPNDLIECSKSKEGEEEEKKFKASTYDHSHCNRACSIERCVRLHVANIMPQPA